jgi:hypothetical protein
LRQQEQHVGKAVEPYQKGHEFSVKEGGAFAGNCFCAAQPDQRPFSAAAHGAGDVKFRRCRVCSRNGECGDMRTIRFQFIDQQVQVFFARGIPPIACQNTGNIEEPFLNR